MPVYSAVMEKGKSFGFTNAGYRALDSLSCEKGYKHWHGDIRPDDTPLEAGLAFTCKLKTGTPFLGRNALEKQRAEGIKRKLITLTLSDHRKLIWGLEGIKRDGKFVGFVRRGEFCYYLGKSVAYGYVTRPDNGVVNAEYLSSGKWALEVMGDSYAAQLHLTHPFDPKNERIKGIY